MITCEEIIINIDNVDDFNEFVAFDTETTGFNYYSDRIIELGAIHFEDDQEDYCFSSLIKTNKYNSASYVNHISQSMLKDAPGESEVYAYFVNFLADVLAGEVVLVMHNAIFDVSFLKATLGRLGYSGHIRYVDTLRLARTYLRYLPNHKQETVANYFNIVNEDAHRAATDAKVCGEIFIKIKELIRRC